MADPGVSPVPQEPHSYHGRPAGIVTRTVAALVDGVVVLLCLLVAYAAVAGLLFVLSPRDFVLPSGRVILSLAAAAVVTVLYLGLSWWLNGRTYGDRLMGLHVVDRRGRDPRLGVALLRALLCVLLPIGILWVAFSRESRSVQDLVMRTAVVYD
jgi:uncharacterized RDD family membrane protein YckC